MSGAAQAQQGAAPGGMRRIPFPVESYQHPSPPLANARLLNFFVEQEPGDARTTAALVATPGAALLLTLGTGPVLAINDDLPGRIYVVSGTHFYRISPPVSGLPSDPLVIDDLGDVGSPAQDVLPPDQLFVSIAVGATAAVVCVPPNAFTCDHGIGDPLNQIGGDFSGAASVAFGDGYFAFTDYSNSARWFISALLDPSSFDALDFAYSDALPNVTRRVIYSNGVFWMMGHAGHEAWYDSGNQDFPYRRVAGAVIPQGTVSPQTICRLDGSVWWLGSDGFVYRTTGYQAIRVSTHAIEYNIQPYGLAYATALAYTQNGHSFYCLTVGIGDDSRTFCYDCATTKWHDRASSGDGSGPWLALVGTTVSNLRWVGDRHNGNIYELMPTLPADNEVNVYRELTFPTMYAATRRAFCSRLEIEMEAGSGIQLVLEWSNDGGWTWPGNRASLITGDVGDRRHRIVTTRLGSFRQRTFRLSMLASTTLYAADADIQAGIT